jgi:hypothetical protein
MIRPLLFLLTLAMPSLAGIVISEVQTQNKSTLRDEDGATPDWVELYNGGTEAANLEGYTLRMGETLSWTIPAVSLAPHQHLVVFASEKNRSVPGSPLHASFELKSGEPLDLLNATGEVVSSVSELPDGPQDTSYGVSEERTITTLVDAAATGTRSSAANQPAGWKSRRSLSHPAWKAGRNGLLAAQKAAGFQLETYRPLSPVNNAEELAFLLARPERRLLLQTELVPRLDASLPVATDGPLLRHARGKARLTGTGRWTLAIRRRDAGAAPAFYGSFGEIPIASPIPDRELAEQGVPPVDDVTVYVSTESGERELDLWWIDQPGEGNTLLVRTARGTLIEDSPAFRVLQGAVFEADVPADLPVGTRLAPSEATAAKSLRQRFRFDVPPGLVGELRLTMPGTEKFRAWIDGKPLPASGVVNLAAITPPTTGHLLAVEAFSANNSAYIYSGPQLIALSGGPQEPLLAYFPKPTPAQHNLRGMGARASYNRDLWARDTLRSLGQPAVHGDYFHVYINGL